jgi:hypothetical protein
VRQLTSDPLERLDAFPNRVGSLRGQSTRTQLLTCRTRSVPSEQMNEYDATCESCGNSWRFLADEEPDFVECLGCAADAFAITLIGALRAMMGFTRKVRKGSKLAC